VRDEKALALAGRLLAVDPKKRPSADDAADDDYFWSPDEATGEFQDPEATDPARFVLWGEGFGGVLSWLVACLVLCYGIDECGPAVVFG
jgi:hypothetical protein